MSEIVPRIDPATIAALIEANINAYLLSFARLPGAVLHEEMRSVWVDSGVDDATFNSVVLARFSPYTVDAGIAEVLDHFRRRGLPVTWHIGPSTQPPDLDRSLLAHGFTHSEDEPGMAVELDQMRDEAAPPPELTIETVRNEAGLAAWVDIWLFPVHAEVRRLYFEVLRQRGLDEALPWQYYIGRSAGRPVAISQFFSAEGAAAVQYVVTLPELRRQGIGMAMTLRVLHEARARGYRVAVLTASPDGIGAYRRIGFREYCWFHRYEWSPGQEAAPDAG